MARRTQHQIAITEVPPTLGHFVYMYTSLQETSRYRKLHGGPEQLLITRHHYSESLQSKDLHWLESQGLKLLTLIRKHINPLFGLDHKDYEVTSTGNMKFYSRRIIAEYAIPVGLDILKDLSSLYSHGLFPALLCLSHFPLLALFGIPVLIPVLPRWPVTEPYPRDLS